MIVNRLNEFADAAALATTATGRQLVGNRISRDAIDHVGNGENLFWLGLVDATFESAGPATVEFELSSDAAAAIATDGSATRHLTTGPIAKERLVKGYNFALRVPNGTAFAPFVGVVANVGKAPLSAGKLKSWLAWDVDRWSAPAAAPGGQRIPPKDRRS